MVNWLLSLLLHTQIIERFINKRLFIITTHIIITIITIISWGLKIDMREM